jgi:hypothetical protein
MEKSSKIAWKIVPLRHFFPLKVVPLIEVLLYLSTTHADVWQSSLDSLLLMTQLIPLVDIQLITAQRCSKTLASCCQIGFEQQVIMTDRS